MGSHSYVGLRGDFISQTFLLISICLLFGSSFFALADNSCDWHAANDAAPDFTHYDTEHDSDGDGIGCETITGNSTAIETTITLIELDETGSFVEETPQTAAQPPEDAPALSDAQPVPAAPSVRLLANSNFRAAPGLQFAIVGGGASGSIYEWTTAQLGPAGYIWYRLALPGGAGWIRGDLVDQLDYAG